MSAIPTLRRMDAAELGETIAMLEHNMMYADGWDREEMERDLSDAKLVQRMRDMTAMRRVQGRNEMRAR